MHFDFKNQLKIDDFEENLKYSVDDQRMNFNTKDEFQYKKFGKDLE